MSNVATKADIARLEKQIKLGRVSDGVGYKVRRNVGGTSLDIRPGTGGALSRPFTLTNASDDNGYKVRIKYGEVNNVIPTNMTAGETVPLVLPVNSGIGHIFIEAIFDDDPDNSVTVTSCEVKTAAGAFVPLPIIAANYWKATVSLGTFDVVNSYLSVASGAGGNVIFAKSGYGFVWGTY